VCKDVCKDAKEISSFAGYRENSDHPYHFMHGQKLRVRKKIVEEYRANSNRPYGGNGPYRPPVPVSTNVPNFHNCYRQNSDSRCGGLRPYRAPEPSAPPHIDLDSAAVMPSTGGLRPYRPLVHVLSPGKRKT
jgi:hypothetical protein